jgi:hypothetical protein
MSNSLTRCLVQLDRGEIQEHCLGRKHSRRLQLLEPNGVLDSDRTDSLTPKRREMGPDTKSHAEIASDGAKIGAGTYYGAKTELGRSVMHQFDMVDRNAHLGQPDHLAATRLPITSFTIDMLGRVLRRPLEPSAKKARQLFPHSNFRDQFGSRRSAEDLSGEIVSGGLSSQAGSGQVLLGLPFDEARQPGGPSQQYDQKAGCKGIECPSVSRRSSAQRTPHSLHHIVRGHSGRLVYQHSADQS